MELSFFIGSALLMGIGGSFHCVGMCGPIAFALSVDRRYKRKLLIQNVLYQLGRVSTYTLLGFIFGFIGQGFTLIGWQDFLSIGMGILLILSAIFSFKKFQKILPLSFIARFVARIKILMAAYLPQSYYTSFFIIGILNGFLPCGLVMSALVAAIATGQADYAALFMLFFGLSTIPTMFTLVWLGSLTEVRWKKKMTKIIPFITIFVGILFLLRGLNLGIPLISPNLIQGGNCH